MQTQSKLTTRVHRAAQAVLDTDGAVGIIDVFIAIGWLPGSSFRAWNRGIESYPVLEKLINCGSPKRDSAVRIFQDWVATKNLEPFDIEHQAAGRDGPRSLQLTADGNEFLEKVFSTKYRSAALSDAKKQRLEKKANKVSELQVFVPLRDGNCSECDESTQGDYVFLENDNALCLDCADMGHLVFLPSGNATLTRRAKKFSKLSAIVLRFNRRRKRYERLGLLVTDSAMAEAEASLEKDADKREAQRARAAVQRDKSDEELIAKMADLILEAYPNCPPQEANEIASHTAQRGSGRVGRSADGRSLGQNAIRLAVVAWVRHQHTNYDELLMKGIDRQSAREQIRGSAEEKLQNWRATQRKTRPWRTQLSARRLDVGMFLAGGVEVVQ